MTDEEVEQALIRIRWAGTQGKPSLSTLRVRDSLCGAQDSGGCAGAEGRADEFLRHVRHAVRVHKMPPRNYLAAFAIFSNEVKGKSASSARGNTVGVETYV